MAEKWEMENGNETSDSKKGIYQSAIRIPKSAIISMPPTVSVNICCYNSEQFLDETLHSVFAQTYTDWELVIVNDGSTDSTEHIIQQYISEGWPIVYHFQPNAGLGASRNKAIQLSNGKFIAFLDHDDLWLPTKLQEQIALFEAHPELGLVYSDCYVEDMREKRSYRISDVLRLHRGWIFNAVLDTNFISLPTVVVRRDVLTAVGPFRPFQILEDHDMLLRIAAQYPVDYVEQPLATYRKHAGQSSRRYEIALRETIEMYDLWNNTEIIQNPEVQRILSRARAQAYYHAGIIAVAYQTEDPDLALIRQYLRQSFTHTVLPGAVGLYLLSFLGSPFVYLLRFVGLPFIMWLRARRSAVPQL